MPNLPPEEYARHIGVAVAQLDHRIFAAHPLAVRINEQYYVRAIQQVHDDLSLSFYCAVENGIVLTAMTPGRSCPTCRPCSTACKRVSATCC